MSVIACELQAFVTISWSVIPLTWPMEGCCTGGCWSEVALMLNIGVQCVKRAFLTLSLRLAVENSLILLQIRFLH